MLESSLKGKPSSNRNPLDKVDVEARMLKHKGSKKIVNDGKNQSQVFQDPDQTSQGSIGKKVYNGLRKNHSQISIGMNYDPEVEARTSAAKIKGPGPLLTSSQLDFS